MGEFSWTCIYFIFTSTLSHYILTINGKINYNGFNINTSISQRKNHFYGAGFMQIIAVQCTVLLLTQYMEKKDKLGDNNLDDQLALLRSV